MQVSFDAQDDFCTITLHGRLDAATAPQFDAAARSVLASAHTRCVVDMHGVSFISSAGLHSFLLLGKALHEKNGALCCAGLNDSVREVFFVSGFSTIFPVFDSLTDAKAHSGAHQGV